MLTLVPCHNLPLNNLCGPGLISGTGPIRDVRFQSNDGVHDLFTTWDSAARLRAA